MKNLAKCTPSEFIEQTVRIKDSAKKWIDAIDIINIRQHKPIYKMVPANASTEERQAIINENAAMKRKQAYNNLSDLLDNMLVKHPTETLEVLALSCFVEPKDVNNHLMEEYMDCIMDMLESKAVMRFLKVLAQVQTQETST